MMRLLLSCLKRDFRIQRSYKADLLFTATALFFSTTSYFFIAHLVPSSQVALAPYGGHYFSFVLVGLALARFQFVALHSFVEKMRLEQTHGTLETIALSRVPLARYLVGATASDFLWAAFDTLIYAALGFWFFHVRWYWNGIAWSVITFALAYAVFLGFGWMGAAWLLRFRRGNPVSWAFGELSEMLGGVYFPLAILPLSWQAVTRWIPMTHALEGLRLSLLQGAGPSSLWPHWFFLGAFATLSCSIGGLTLQRAWEHARRDGTLSHQ